MAGLTWAARGTLWPFRVGYSGTLTAWRLYNMMRMARLKATGWVLQSQCPGVEPLWSPGSGASQLCGVGVHVGALRSQMFLADRRTQNSLSTYGGFFWAVGNFLCRRSETWIRNVVLTPGLAPRIMQHPRPRVRPLPFPQVDPFTPPHQQEPVPRPVPWKAIPGIKLNPWRAPGEQPERGNQSNAPPLGRTEWEFDSDKLRNPMFQPTPRPRTRPAANPKPADKPRTKERKVRAVSLAGTAIGKVISNLTETGDALNAFWDSIPLRYRAHYFDKDGVMKPIYVGFKQKLRDIYNYWDKVSLPDLARNLALNQAEDWVFGKIGGINAAASAEFGNMTGRPVGFQFGQRL